MIGYFLVGLLGIIVGFAAGIICLSILSMHNINEE